MIECKEIIYNQTSRDDTSWNNSPKEEYQDTEFMTKDISGGINGPKDPKNVFTISFETFKNFLYENNHIDKKQYENFRPYCRYLDKYVSKLENPFYEFYGLFDANDLIGVTSIQEWQDNELFKEKVFRYRYIYIKKQYRGQDLAWKFLTYVCKFPLFAYAKDSHIQWCVNKNFKKILNPTLDGHQFLLLDGESKESLFEKNFNLQAKDINELI